MDRGEKGKEKLNMKKEKMVVERLYFHRLGYGKDEGQYSGEIEFSCKMGKISVTLDSKLSSILLETCKDNIQQLASEAASTFKGAVEDALKSHKCRKIKETKNE